MQSTRIIVDTDAGTDDLMALAFLLSRPDVEIEAITIAPGLAHAEPGAINVRRLLRLAGRDEIPVHVGRHDPLPGGNEFPAEWRTATDDLPGVDLPVLQAPQSSGSAVDFLTRRMRQADSPVVLLALGALTNIAEALDGQATTHGGIRRLVIMGGAFDVPGNVRYGGDPDNVTAEWNFHIDPEAARRVFESTVPISLVPLDATNDVPLSRSYVTALEPHAKRRPLARLVVQILELVGALLDADEAYAWDQLAAASIVEPAVISTRRRDVEIRLAPPETGRSVAIPGGPGRVDVAFAADERHFRDVFVNSLAGRISPT
jgi:pyrimidine-specific ribonucleoside hydrolase